MPVPKMMTPISIVVGERDDKPTLGVIVVISVFNPFDAAAWILAISKTLSCHVFEFPKKSFVFICVVKLDFDTFRLTTHIFDSLFNILFSLNHLSNV